MERRRVYTAAEMVEIRAAAKRVNDTHSGKRTLKQKEEWTDLQIHEDAEKAERVVAERVKGTRVKINENGKKDDGWDVKGADGKRLQVKGTPKERGRFFVPVRHWEKAEEEGWAWDVGILVVTGENWAQVIRGMEREEFRKKAVRGEWGYDPVMVVERDDMKELTEWYPEEKKCERCGRKFVDGSLMLVRVERCVVCELEGWRKENEGGIDSPLE